MLLPRFGEELLNAALLAATGINFLEAEFILLKFSGDLGAGGFADALVYRPGG
jgi:hypothetical protein